MTYDSNRPWWIIEEGHEPEWFLALEARARLARTQEERDEIWESDPTWVAMIEARHAAAEEKGAALSRAAKPLIRELHAAGLDVASVWSINEKTPGIEQGVPILLDHLSRPYPDRLREAIARALAVRSMRKELWPKLVEFYRAEPSNTDAKDGLAAAMSMLANKAVLDEVIELVTDRRNGTSRGFMLINIARSRNPEHEELLKQLAKDPELKAEAERILKNKARRRAK